MGKHKGGPSSQGRAKKNCNFSQLYCEDFSLVGVISIRKAPLLRALVSLQRRFIDLPKAPVVSLVYLWD